MKKKPYCIMLLAGILGWMIIGAAFAAPIPPDWTRNQIKQAVLHNPPTYDGQRSTWQAKWIELPVPKEKTRITFDPAELESNLNATNKNTRCCMKKTLELPAAPADAALCIFKNPMDSLEAKQLFINGRRVMPPRWGLPLDRYTDLAGYFRKGKNVIAIGGACRDRKGHLYADMIVEGMVRLPDGQILRLLSDETWKGMFDPAPGWEKDDAGDSAWPDVKVRKGTLFTAFDRGDAYHLNPPYYGPIEIQPPDDGHYLYDAGQALRIPVTVWGNNIGENYHLRWRLAGAETEETVQSGVLAENCDWTQTIAEAINMTVASPGAYDLFIEIGANDKTLAGRVEEIAVVGKIEQREVKGSTYTDGLDLELTDEIDCTTPDSPLLEQKEPGDAAVTDELDLEPADEIKDAKPSSPYRFFSESARGTPQPSVVRETNLGKYRESGENPYDWFGFGVKLNNVFAPYLVEVDYPDDKIRLMSIRVVQMGGANHRFVNDATGHLGWPLTAPGFYTGIDHELSGEMRTFRFICFPKNAYMGIVVMNHRAGMPAAAARIRIYRVKNDLPALKISAPGHRLTGQHLERSSVIPRTFYSGPDDMKFCVNLCEHPHRGFYKDWYNAIDNMIKYMRFTAENLLVAGIYMYFEDNGWMWRTKEAANYLELMGRMCDANGIKLLLGVEYGTSRRREPVGSDEAVAQSAYTKRTVSKDGTQVKNWCKSTNFLVPEVREHLLDVVGQLADLYKNTPGIIGVCFQEGGGYLPCFTYPVSKVKDPLDWGYDDITTAAFEKDTGIAIPVAADDPERFRKRYDWLMENARDKWIDWRNLKLYEINRDMGNILHAANPAWRLYIVSSLTKAYDGLQSPETWFRRHSFDVARYKNDPNIVFGTRYLRFIRVQGSEFVTSRIWSSNPDVIRVTNDGLAYVLDGFFETHLHSKSFYFDSIPACDYILPSGRAWLDAFARTLSYATPQTMLQTWLDVNMLTGHEETRREFNRAFQVIPPGDYRTLTGDGLDRNIVIRSATIPSGIAFYMVNYAPWPIQTAVQLNGTDLKVANLALGENYALKNGNILEQDLKAFEIRAYSLLGEHPGFHSAETRVPAKIADLYLKKYQAIKAIQNGLKQPDKDLPADLRLVVNLFGQLVAQVDLAVKDKNWSKAWELLDGYYLSLLTNKLQDVKSSIAWRIIGPYANPQSKGFDIPYPVEKDVLAGHLQKKYQDADGKPLEWRNVVAESIGNDRGFVNFIDLYKPPTDWKVAYAQTAIKSDKDRKVKLLLGSDDGIKVWLNGALVFNKLVSRPLLPQQDIVAAELKKGWNIVLIKVENQRGGWAFFWDIVDPGGNTIPGLEYEIVKPN